MLCPEVWKFLPPSTQSKEITGNIRKGGANLPAPLANLNFGHYISLVIPSSEELNNITRSFNNDLEYYKAINVTLSDLCSKEFIENFIRKGSLTAVSDKTRIDADNCVCVTPEGVLVLSLDKKTYQQLGLHGKVSNFSSDRYIIQLNLKEEKFTSNKTQYQKTKQYLNARLQKFSLLINWEPPDQKICPSSIAKFLNERGYNVEVCKPKFTTRSQRNSKMPVISKNKDDLPTEELVEWIGMFAVDSTIVGSSDSYVNSYVYPEDTVPVKGLTYVEWTGFFTVHQIKRLYCSVLRQLTGFTDAPWIALYVQGLSDVPVNSKLEEHHYYSNGDNGHILFLEPNGDYLVYTKSCSNKKYRK